MIALAFVPLLAGWALLHRTSRRKGWSYVGEPPSPMLVAARVMTRNLVRTHLALAEVLIPAMQAATAALRTFGDDLKKAGLPL